MLNIEDEDVNRFIEIIKMETSLIDSTIECRSAFLESVSRHKDLTVVQVENFVGLGAVR